MKVLVQLNVYIDGNLSTSQSVVEMTAKEYKFFSNAHNKVMDVINDINESIDIINLAFAKKTNKTEFLTKKEKMYFGEWPSNPSIFLMSECEAFICTGIVL